VNNLSGGQHALWHPFADMSSVEGNRFVLTRGEGALVWDEDGREYLDATAALWYSNLGHGRVEIADAVRRQLLSLDAYSIFGDYANQPAIELADRLSALAAAPDTKVFLGSGGSDMIETAAKIARLYHAERGERSRTHLIGRHHGYHGTHGIGTSVGGIVANKAGLGDLVQDVSQVEWDSPSALEAEIERLGEDRVAAFFCEPVMGAGGVRIPPEGYLEAVAAICREHGVLFIADCVIGGFGRLGTWLGIDRWSVVPDMIVTAKAVTGGTLPLGALLVSGEVAEPFFRPGGGTPFLHGPTYAGHPACCAAALTALDLYESEGLIERGRELEQPLAEVLAPLADHRLVREVRAGVGFIAAVEVTDGARAADPGIIAQFQRSSRDAGLLVRPLATSIALSPPLTCGQAELDRIGEGLAEALERLDVTVAI
jgi:adenosylmethionine-8-amino-7-oxononanoate aminotransferase